MRCLTLANAAALRGFGCFFVSRDLHGSLATKITSSGHASILLPQEGPPAPMEAGQYGQWLGTTEEHDSKSVIDALSELASDRCKLVVVDHYGLSSTWEASLNSTVGIPILALDDLDRRHESAFVLDVTFGKTAANYEGQLTEGTRALVGPSYALLRPDFALLRSPALQGRDARLSHGTVNHVLVSMGGADETNATLWVTDALATLLENRSFKIHVLLGAAYPHRASLDTLQATLGNRLEIHSDVAEMAALLADMDLAIGAAGSSSWERCCLGLPTINLVLAENQVTVARLLASGGAAIDGGRFPTSEAPDMWAKRIIAPVLASSTLIALSGTARDLVDGRGAGRVIAEAFSGLVRTSLLVLRGVTMDDAALLFEWQCDGRTRRYALNPAPPTWSEHLKWLQRKLNDPYCSFYIAEVAGIASGTVRLDRSASPPPPTATEHEWREVSILTAPEFYGCGVGLRMIRALMALHPEEDLVARVLADNQSSQRLFAKAGFSHYAPELLFWPQQTNRGIS
ncbi:UDP-2,4-diacetamido-2,4,6-trideoxy-beta-L-altropyranose hydrolase [Devosia limi DSM 17137]|nr:UDP-2,4-diacetamido-2,4,6-trideoxy-beta-L-altropyranose hydrolase [Devosia limi DSM 17137]